MMVKIGRNDPCHCGSGKKYKKCCIERDTSAERTSRPTALIEEPEIEANYGVHSIEEVLEIVGNQLEWIKPEYEQIARSIAAHMHDDGYGPPLILEAVALWQYYSKDTQPIVRKPEVVCAAIEYTIAEAHGVEVSQAELAQKYGVAAASISKRFKEILAYTEANGLLPEGYTDGESPSEIEADFDPEEYFVLQLPSLKKALDRELKKLDKSLFEEAKGVFWLETETRPFLRAKYAYAEGLWHAGKSTEAAQQLEEILELNEMDNLGARDLLLSAYLDLKQLQAAERLLQAYADDASATFAYHRIILEYLKNGISSALKLQARVARRQNPHVVAYLSGAKRMPSDLPDFIGNGDENEAVTYVAHYARLWVAHPELCKWILEQGW